MANYTKATNFAAKDTLTTGDPAKIVKGTEIDDEFNAIATAINSKANTNSPTLTGTPLAPTAAAGTNTTQIATTAYVVAERDATATLTNKTLTSPTINSPTIATPTLDLSGVTSSGDLAVADGGTGASTANGALTNLLPSQTSNSGKYLTTNGTNTSWGDPTPTTSNVLAATAGASYGAVGTYAWLGSPAGSTLSVGSTYSGSSLRYAGTSSTNTFNDNTAADVTYTGVTPTGTWRAMGYASARGATTTMFLRIS